MALVSVHGKPLKYRPMTRFTWGGMQTPVQSFLELGLEPSPSCICHPVGEACLSPAQCSSEPTCWALWGALGPALGLTSGFLSHSVFSLARWSAGSLTHLLTGPCAFPLLSLIDSRILYPASGRNYIARAGWPGMHTP